MAIGFYTAQYKTDADAAISNSPYTYYKTHMSIAFSKFIAVALLGIQTAEIK
jgi:hypothetical protein